jgi:hypothetical protein
MNAYELDGYEVVKRHPFLPLAIARHGERIFVTDGNKTIGYTLSNDFVYACFYNNEIVCYTRTGFDAYRVIRARQQIIEEYWPAFRILCEHGVTAIVSWDEGISLVGVIAGYWKDEPIWTSAERIYSWPGKIKTLEVK